MEEGRKLMEKEFSLDSLENIIFQIDSQKMTAISYKSETQKYMIIGFLLLSVLVLGFYEVVLII